MPDTKKPHKKSLSQVVDEIEGKKEKAIKYVLFLRYAEREGIELSTELPIAYNFEPGFADYIINTLADMYLNLKIPPKKKALDPVFQSIESEIKLIYKAIKKNAGVSGCGKEIEEKRKQAALNCFDDRKYMFEAIKREYLKDRYLYQFAERQGKRDFEKRIIKKIIKDNFSNYNINRSEDALWKDYKKAT